MKTLFFALILGISFHYNLPWGECAHQCWVLPDHGDHCVEVPSDPDSFCRLYNGPGGSYVCRAWNNYCVMR